MIPAVFILVLICVVVGIFGLVRLAVQRRRRAAQDAKIEQARVDFHLQRERVEAHFVRLAGASGRPRGLRWTDVQFDDPVSFARERHTRQLTALVAITISFEAIEGGGMEDVEAVGNLRAGTAVFFFDGQRWDTLGRAIFNLEPIEALRHFQHELEADE